MPACNTLRRRIGQAAHWGSIAILLTIAGPLTVDAGRQNTGQTATEAVQSTVSDLMRVLDDDSLKQPEQAEERRREIEEIIRQRVDYEEMAQRALGAPWPTLPRTGTTRIRQPLRAVAPRYLCRAHYRTSR